MLAKIVKAILWVLLAAGGLWVLFLLGDVFMAWWLYSWFFQKIHEGSGFPDLITGAIAVWCMAAVLLALPTIVSSFVWRKNRKWTLLTASLVSFWFVGVYFVSRPAPGHLFNPITGRPQFRYARNLDGKIKLFPLGYAYHPRYGMRLEYVTTTVATEYEEQEAERVEVGPVAAEAAHPPTTMPAITPVTQPTQPQANQLTVNCPACPACPPPAPCPQQAPPTPQPIQPATKGTDQKILDYLNKLTAEEPP